MRIHPTVAAQSLGVRLPFFCDTQEDSVTIPFFKDNQPNSTTKTSLGPLVKYPLKFLCKLPSILIYSTLFLIGAGSTPGFWKEVNAILQSEGFGYVPKPQGEKITYVRNYAYPFDNFVQNFNGFDLILEAIHRANINPDSLDLDKSGYILDTKEELKELIVMLGELNPASEEEKELYTKATSLLRDINTISQLIWGNEGPNPNVVSQNEEPTCQGTSPLRGLFIPPELTQAAKGMVRVTNYSLGENPFIDTKVLINGREINTPYSELARSQSPIAYNASASTDDSLFTGIFSLAMKKASPDRIPNFWPSSSLTLLTNTNYSVFGLMAFSDSELDEILSSSNESLMTVASTFTLGDVKNGLELRVADWVNPPCSRVKENNFRNRTLERKNDIQAGRTPKENKPSLPEKPTQLASTASFPPGATASKPATTPKPILGPKDVRRGHVYLKENYDMRTGVLRISDSHGDVVNLPRNEIRKRLIAVVAEDDKLDFFSDRSFPTYGLVIGAGLGYFFGKRKIKGLVLRAYNKSA